MTEIFSDPEDQSAGEQPPLPPALHIVPPPQPEELPRCAEHLGVYTSFCAQYPHLQETPEAAELARAKAEAEEDARLKAAADEAEEITRRLLNKRLNHAADTLFKAEQAAAQINELPIEDPYALFQDDSPPDQPTVGLRIDGKGMFYPQKIHAVYSEPEAGKSWLMAYHVAALIMGGKYVRYLDFEDNLKTLVSRLKALGCSHYSMIFLKYTAVRAPFTRTAIETEPESVLTVIDGVTEAMTLFGKAPKADEDCAWFINEIVKPFSGNGSAVVQLDHVVKDTDSRGRFATGSQHKLSALDGAAYTLTSISPFGRGREGMSRLHVMKDRPGGVRSYCERNPKTGKDHFGDFVLRGEDNGLVTVKLFAPIPEVSPEFECDVLKRRILEAIGKGANSKTSIRTAVGGARQNSDEALLQLRDDGLIDWDATDGGRPNYRVIEAPNANPGDPG